MSRKLFISILIAAFLLSTLNVFGDENYNTVVDINTDDGYAGEVGVNLDPTGELESVNLHTESVVDNLDANLRWDTIAWHIRVEGYEEFTISADEFLNEWDAEIDEDLGRSEHVTSAVSFTAQNIIDELNERSDTPLTDQEEEEIRENLSSENGIKIDATIKLFDKNLDNNAEGGRNRPFHTFRTGDDSAINHVVDTWNYSEDSVDMWNSRTYGYDPDPVPVSTPDPNTQNLRPSFIRNKSIND